MSSQQPDAEIDAIIQGVNGNSGGVAFGKELIAFADAAVARSADLPAAREAVRKVLGETEVVEAAATIANFQRMVRIADGTGIALDDVIDGPSAEMRRELGLNQFTSAEGRSAMAH